MTKKFLLTLSLLFIITSLQNSLAQNYTLTLNTRTIEFSGCKWYVKSGYYGPGPNYWSDSEQSVWVDEKRRLHLKIRKINNTWYCAEVFTKYYTTFGEHRFLVDSRVDQLDNNVVLGLFTYADDSHEIDIEFAKWGYPNNTKMGSFTVQPYAVKGNSEKFEIELATTLSTHYFNWQPDYILFGSIQGHHEGLLPAPKYFIHQWIYWGDYIPESFDKLHTHINFWLFQGKSPINTNNLEVIITKVFQPLTTGIEENNEGSITPDDFRLCQNYPNPFNPETIISYAVPVDSSVELAIYNTLGKKICILVNEKQGAGHYHVQWDGKDGQGNSVTNGIYFYTLKISGKARISKKMILVK